MAVGKVAVLASQEMLNNWEACSNYLVAFISSDKHNKLNVNAVNAAHMPYSDVMPENGDNEAAIVTLDCKPQLQRARIREQGSPEMRQWYMRQTTAWQD